MYLFAIKNKKTLPTRNRYKLYPQSKDTISATTMKYNQIDKKVRNYFMIYLEHYSNF